jgi:curved DNA-binding protein CbpA
MKTLYDVLNIRADDDAESVRKAFRKAAKANHPDLNAGDPDAQSRFAQIVRANTILRDPELRAIYDGMLEFEGQQCRPQSKLVVIFNAARSIAANAIIGFVLAFVLAGGFTYLSKASDVTARESGAVAAVPPLAPVDIAAQLKAVRPPRSSVAALGAPVDVADSHHRAQHGAARRGRIKLHIRHPRDLLELLGLRRNYHAGLIVTSRPIW